METFTIILIIIAVLVLAVFVFLLYSGFFYTYSIRCTVPASLPTRFAYTVHVGPYEKVGSVFGKLNSLVPQKRLFGVYYDNPEKVPSKLLRSIIGCDLQGIADERTEERLKQNGYNISKFPNCTKALVTEFPYRTTFSIWIAVKRVYPALMKYIEDYKVKNAGPFLEIYKDDAIQYVVILDNNEGFYVPEISKDSQVYKDDTKKIN